jgi:hypothetical protein
MGVDVLRVELFCMNHKYDQKIYDAEDRLHEHIVAAHGSISEYAQKRKNW